MVKLTSWSASIFESFFVSELITSVFHRERSFLLWLVTCVGVIVVNTIIAYRQRSKYWKDRGVDSTSFFFEIKQQIYSFTGLKPFFIIADDLYKACRGPYLGLYQFSKPTLFVRDPELIEKVLIKDFGSFVDRGISGAVETPPIDRSLFFYNGDEWRAVRNKLVPTFTSGRIKKMYELTLVCGDKLVEKIRKSPVDHDPKITLSNYTMDVIGTTVFGIDITAVQESDPKFREYVSKVFDFSFKRLVVLSLGFAFPKLGAKLGVSFTPRDAADYFAKIIKDTFEIRKNGEKRDDFVQLLLELREKGSVEAPHRPDLDDQYLEQGKEHLQTTFKVEFDDDRVLGLAYQFFSAGFEGTSSSISFTLFNLATNPGPQAKAKEEVRRVIQKHGGQFTYQALKDMVYLEQVIDETQRLFPLVTQLMRQCNKTYKLGDITVESGTNIVIPVSGLHMDPLFFPEPERFIPERFGPEMSRPPCTYLPFGDGPRMCIAMRYAKVFLKVAVAKILHNFSVELSPKVSLPLKMDSRSFIPKTAEPLYMTFKEN